MRVFSDSKLVVGQVRGDLEACDTRMQEYLCQIRIIQEKFEVFDLSHIPRSGNTHADSLATLATSLAQDLPRVVLVEDLYTHTSVHQGTFRIHHIRLGPSWMDSISLFLEKDVLPEEKSKADIIRRKAPRFWLFEDKKFIQALFLWSLLALCTPRSIKITFGGAARRGLWKSYRRKIPVSQGSYPRIPVAKHAKRGAGIC